MTKVEAASQVRATLTQLKAFVAASGSTSTSEADTRAHFIDPVIRALGYSDLGEMQREVYVKDTKEFIDYVLTINGSRRIAVEAKRLSHKLNEGDAAQLVQYCEPHWVSWRLRGFDSSGLGDRP